MEKATVLSRFVEDMRQRVCRRAELRQVVGAARRYGGPLIFALGLLVYLCAQGGLVLTPILNRSVPAEADDAYAYILSAVQMRDCFWQDCQAMEDLRHQLSVPSADYGVAWTRFRTYRGVFPVYHPLHSALLLLLHSLGASWEAAYDAVRVVGAILIGIAAGYWLERLWGPGPAGIALAILAFSVFPKQGLHYIVPSNLALGIGILTWALILRGGRLAQWAMLGGTVAMVAMHPLGRVYGIVAVVTHVLFSDHPVPRRTWVLCGVSLLIVAIPSALPWLVWRPELSLSRGPAPKGWTSLQGVLVNLDEGIDIIRKWTSAYEGFLSAGLLLSVGFLSASSQRRQRVAAMALQLGGVLGASLFLVLHKYPGDAFARVWVAAAVLLSGAVGQAAWAWLSSVSDSLRSLVSDGLTRISSSDLILSARGWGLVLLLLIGLVLGRSGAHYARWGVPLLRETADYMTERQQIALDPKQPTTLLSGSREGESVLYMADIPLYYFLTRGGLDRGAVYYPALAGTPEEPAWLDDNDSIEYVVAWNPIQRLPIAREGGLDLLPGESLQCRVRSAGPSSPVRLWLVNRGEDAVLGLHLLESGQPEGQGEVRELQVPAGWNGWLEAPVEEEFGAAGFSLEVLDASEPVQLKGLRLGRTNGLNWPWDQGVTLVHVPADEDAVPQTIGFESSQLGPSLGRRLRPLADGGSTVLARVGEE